MNTQIANVLEDAVIAEIAFLLHAKLNRESEETASSLLRMAECYSDAAELADLNPEVRPIFNEIIDGMNDFTKSTIGHVIAQLTVMAGTDPNQKVAELKQPMTLVRIMGLTVHCYGKVDWRRVVTVYGICPRNISPEPVRQIYLAQKDEAWLSILMKLVPMMLESDIYVTEVYGA